MNSIVLFCFILIITILIYRRICIIIWWIFLFFDLRRKINPLLLFWLLVLLFLLESLLFVECFKIKGSIFNLISYLVNNWEGFLLYKSLHFNLPETHFVLCSWGNILWLFKRLIKLIFFCDVWILIKKPRVLLSK